MATPGPGNRQPVAANPRLAPAYSLLDAAVMVPPELADEGAVTQGPLAGLRRGPRWLNGIRYRREKCGVATARYAGCAAEHPASLTRESDEIETDPFTVGAGELCSAFGWQAADYVGRATRFLAASEAYAVEREFWTGTQAKDGIAHSVPYAPDQWLAQQVTATVLNSGNPIHPMHALGLLQEALGNCSGGGPGMLHMRPRMADIFWQLQQISPIPGDGGTFSAQRKILDGRGNVVVPGFGYPGTGPDGSNPPTGASWIYATGMVYIRRDDYIVTPDTFAQALDRVKNDIRFRVDRDYLVDWDRCCHIAALVYEDVSADVILAS